jgi:hypothetical protein
MGYPALSGFLDYSEMVLQDSVDPLFIVLGTIAFLVLIALYVYRSITWMTIAKKMKYKKAWLAWIPFAHSAMKLQLGKFHWAWVFLFLIPIFGWLALIILLTTATWRIYEKQKYPGWLALAFPAMFVPKISIVGLVAHLVIIGFVAWKKKR